MADDRLGVNLSKDAMSEAVVIALQKLAKLQRERDDLLFAQDVLVAIQNELVAALKTILCRWDASEDMEREINEARVLVARVEAE